MALNVIANKDILEKHVKVNDRHQASGVRGSIQKIVLGIWRQISEA